MTDAPEPNADIPEDFHPYVRLLIIRMRSHPEEFNPLLEEPHPRVKDYMTPEESAFVWAEERKQLLNAKHEQLMRGIMRADEPPEPTAIQKLAALQSMQSMAQSLASQNNYNSLMNSQPIYPGTTNAQQISLGYPIAPTAATPATITAGTITSNGSNVVTEENLVEKMRKALGI